MFAPSLSGQMIVSLKTTQQRPANFCRQVVRSIGPGCFSTSSPPKICEIDVEVEAGFPPPVCIPGKLALLFHLLKSFRLRCLS
jgi:hypothetical protein